MFPNPPLLRHVCSSKERSHPFICAKLLPSVLFLTDLGCGCASNDLNVDVTSSSHSVETWPVENNDDALLNEHGKRKYAVVCTHCHYDHISSPSSSSPPTRPSSPPPTLHLSSPREPASDHPHTIRLAAPLRRFLAMSTSMTNARPGRNATAATALPEASMTPSRRSRQARRLRVGLESVIGKTVERVVNVWVRSSSSSPPSALPLLALWLFHLARSAGGSASLS
ncbi:hypothetical protein DFH11DRAFT_1732163 [Phellopilus nigrolimitatus]|nr:hypothetical protein DFH11DRAFT_1732163 [Phellopilus nigrolimitatus]